MKLKEIIQRSPRKAVISGLVIAAVGLASLAISNGAPLEVQLPADTANPDEPTEQIIVQYKANSDIAKLRGKFNQLDVREVDEVKSYRVKVLKVPKSQREKTIKALEADPQVQSAEADVIYTATLTTPNDPEYTKQWAWTKTQTNIAWDKARGSANTVVAVLDSGMNFAHPEFAGKTVPGIDTINSDNDPTADQPHGTQVAGTVAALTNNGIGVAGGCWNCKIMPIKVLDSKGSGTGTAVLKGIEFATNNGAKIINLSLAGPGSSAALQTAVDQAVSKGILVVGAAGNNGRLSSAMTPQFPANYNGVISVSATDQNDALTDFSSHWPQVDIAAPGIVVTSTYPGTGYATVQGTSFSAPVVSAILAILVGQYPAATHAELTDAILSTADACCGGKIAGGRINAAKAQAKLEAKYPSGTNPTPPPTPPVPNPTPTPNPNPTPAKPSDLNGDSRVNITDLSILLSNWNKPNATKAQGDLNGDAKVNITDLSILLKDWTK